jgi:hypothetical protein
MKYVMAPDARVNPLAEESSPQLLKVSEFAAQALRAIAIGRKS